MIDITSFREMDTVENPSKEEFYLKYGIPSVPVRIRGATKDWNAMKSWSLESFRERAGDLELYADRFTEKNHDIRRFTLSEYVDYVNNCDDELPYYLTSCQFHRNTDMMSDYSPPDYFSNWLQMLPVEQRPFFSWIFIGAKNTHSPLHLDVWNTSAWNAVISGKKLWFFYSPDQIDLLYKDDINPFDPDYDKYPYLRRTKPLYCIQEPGDIIFTPSNWNHAVLNLESGISITENFINETNFKFVREHFRIQKMHRELNLLNKYVFEIGAVSPTK